MDDPEAVLEDNAQADSAEAVVPSVQHEPGITMDKGAEAKPAIHKEYGLVGTVRQFESHSPAGPLMERRLRPFRAVYAALTKEYYFSEIMTRVSLGARIPFGTLHVRLDDGRVLLLTDARAAVAIVKKNGTITLGVATPEPAMHERLYGAVWDEHVADDMRNSNLERIHSGIIVDAEVDGRRATLFATHDIGYPGEQFTDEARTFAKQMAAIGVATLSSYGTLVE